MNHHTDCPKCFRSKWTATGRFNINRHGRRRAELVCDFCRYAFSSGHDDAIQAGEAVPDPNADLASIIPQRSLPHTRIPQQGDHEMTVAGTLAKDWKAAQSGED